MIDHKTIREFRNMYIYIYKSLGIRLKYVVPTLLFLSSADESVWSLKIILVWPDYLGELTWIFDRCISKINILWHWSQRVLNTVKYEVINICCKHRVEVGSLYYAIFPHENVIPFFMKTFIVNNGHNDKIIIINTHWWDDGPSSPDKRVKHSTQSERKCGWLSANILFIRES